MPLNWSTGGKSAFLTALTIVLGGKAATTGRGTGLKDFVRTAEGVTCVDSSLYRTSRAETGRLHTSQAQIILKLMNKGPDAWRPEDYGDTITVTRTINRDGGGGGTKLSSASGKTVASKLSELANICDHFNISVDNPINILSQDAARQFLTDSTPQKKYELFLKGTLLAQLESDYEKLHSSKHKLTQAFEETMAGVHELRKEKDAAAKKWKAAEAVAEKADTLHRLEALQAWAVAKKHEAVTSHLMMIFCSGLNMRFCTGLHGSC